MRLSLDFENVAIQQKKNICSSRMDVDISSEIIKGVKRPTPIIASNMSTVINSKFYIKIYKLGALAVMHRAIDIDTLTKEIKTIANECEWVAASIGISDNDFKFYPELIKSGTNVIVIDIAHGYCDKVINLARDIKQKYPSIKVIVGNTVNTGLLKECAGFVDAIKVGVGSGMACETAIMAGCTEKQFSAVLKFKNLARKYGVPIISDGGIRQPSDFVKAIGAGANSIMAGSIFCACPESAGPTKLVGGQYKKVYAGMASRYVQELWKGGLKDGTCPEGKKIYLDLGESVDKLLERYSGALRSGITYAGANNITNFQNTVEFVRFI